MASEFPMDDIADSIDEDGVYKIARDQDEALSVWSRLTDEEKVRRCGSCVGDGLCEALGAGEGGGRWRMSLRQSLRQRREEKRRVDERELRFLTAV